MSEYDDDSATGVTSADATEVVSTEAADDEGGAADGSGDDD